MRNALVLVLLCIGLTSGFIVSTSTSKTNERTESLWTSNPEGTSTEKSEITNTSIKTDISHFNNEEEIGKEMLTQGSDDVKHVNERSFVFVNQRWKKTLYKSHLNEPNLNRNSLYQEVLRNSEKNKLRQRNYAAKKNLSSVIENKKYFPPNTQHDGNALPYYGAYTKKTVDNREVNQQRDYIYHIKEPIATTKSDNNITMTHKKSAINVTSNPYVRSGGNISANREKYSQDFMELLDDVQSQHENNSQIQYDKGYEIYENDLLFKDRAHENREEENIDSFWPHKLSHLTLEEQAPQTQSFQKYNSSHINNFKYCQECTWKLNAQNYTDYLDLECTCKCGRYIHLRGPQKMRDFMNKRRSIC